MIRGKFPFACLAAIGLVLAMSLVGLPSQVSTASSAAVSKPNALFPIMVNYKHGYIDMSGKIVVPPVYLAAEPFSEGAGAVQFANSKFGFIDSTGRIIIPAQFDGVGPFREGLARVTIKDKSGFIDKSGQFVIPLSIGEGPRFRPWGVGDFSDGLADISTLYPARSGFIDRKGRFLFSIFQIKHGTIDGIIEGDFHDGFAKVVFYLPSPGGRTLVGYADHTGRISIAPKFENGGHFSEGLAPVAIKTPKGVRWGFIDRSGKFALPAAYTWASEFNSGLASASTGEKQGYIDKTGRMVIAEQFDHSHPIHDGMGIAQKQASYFVITKNRSVVPLPADVNGVHVDVFRHGLAKVLFKDNTYGYANASGVIVWRGSHK